MRLCVGLAVAAVISLAVPAAGGPSRTLVTPYSGASLLYVPGSETTPPSAFGTQCGEACVTFTVGRKEARATVSVRDASGASVAWVAQRGRMIAQVGCGTGRLTLRRGEQWFVKVAVVRGCGAPTKGELKVLVSS